MTTINRMPRNVGVTDSERYLQKLTERTFLSMWSHVGVFKDKKQNGKGDGKELCDVLVVFENHVIIFSDKDWAFPQTGNLDVDWRRWYKRAVFKSAKQAAGAERWLRMFGNTRIFLDRACTIPFPAILPEMSKAQFHHVLVAKNASKFCRKRLGGSGSLMLSSEFFDYEDRDAIVPPFKIGQVIEGQYNVHVFDDVTLDVILGTQDTVSDFVDYLIAKEKLLEQYHVSAGGEEELLANFFEAVDQKTGKHFFNIPDGMDVVIFLEGDWGDFLKSDRRKKQIEENKISFFFDAMVERFIETSRTDNPYLKQKEQSIEDYESLLRWLARENRTRRRVIAKAIYEWIKITGEAGQFGGGGRVLLPSRPGDPHYLILCMPFPVEMEKDEDQHRKYREARVAALKDYGKSVKDRYKDVHHLIGIATESGFKNKLRSEDIIHFDCSLISDEDAREATKFLKSRGLIKKPKLSFNRDHEFPVAQQLVHIGRNHSCPCGSGKRFKRCCGKDVIERGLK